MEGSGVTSGSGQIITHPDPGGPITFGSWTLVLTSFLCVPGGGLTTCGNPLARRARLPLTKNHSSGFRYQHPHTEYGTVLAVSNSTAQNSAQCSKHRTALFSYGGWFSFVLFHTAPSRFVPLQFLWFDSVRFGPASGQCRPTLFFDKGQVYSLQLGLRSDLRSAQVYSVLLRSTNASFVSVYHKIVAFLSIFSVKFSHIRGHIFRLFDTSLIKCARVSTSG